MNAKTTLSTLVFFTAFLAAAGPGVAEKDAGGFTPVTTKELRGGQTPVKLSVDVSGLDQLWLLATAGNDDYHHDRAVWADPVLVDTEGRRVELGTLKPASVKVGWGTLLVDKALGGGPLRIGKKKFKKGFWAHAPSALQFALDGKYKTFAAWVGIGGGARKNGSSVFRVLKAYDKKGMQQYPNGKKAAGPAGGSDPVAVDVEALERAIRDLTETFGEKYPKGKAFLDRLEELREAPEGAARAKDLRALRAEALTANPLLDFEKLLVIRRKANNLGMPCNWQSNSSIRKTGYDNEIATLSPVAPGGTPTTLFRPDKGEFVGDVALDYDATKMLFSMPSNGGKGPWQVFEINADGTGRRQVTTTENPQVNNYDACYLPDGNILFCSTAPCVAVPCVRGSAPVATLHRCGPNGENMRQLAFDQDHSWCPVIMANGTVLYERWEYTDLPHSNSRILFTMNPDGTNQRSFYGSNSYWPNSVFYARPVPGSSTVFAGIVTGHHGPRRVGELVIFDAARGSTEAEGAVQKIPGYGKKVEAVIADRLTGGSWPKFLHPWPLSEKYYLVSMKPSGRGLWGIYLVDVFDNMLLLAEESGYAMLEPVPLRPRPAPPVIPDRRDPARDDAEIFVSDIYFGPGLEGIPRGEVKKLRLYTYTYGYPGVGGLYGSIGMDGPWDMRRTIGTVPVYEDGSASFRVPANTPVAIQPLDAEGKAMQIMRSWFTAMPGERLSCAGCHENPNDAVPPKNTIASNRPPAAITPWRGPGRNYEFQRELQPVLDKYCVGCHDGREEMAGKKLPDLRGTKMISGWKTRMDGNTGTGTGGKFSVSYAALHRYVRRPGIESPIHLMTPMEFHADTTELVQMLMKGHHKVRLDDEAWDRLITWIDFNAPYHGRWSTLVGKKAVKKERQRAELRKRYAGVDEDHEHLPPERERTITPVVPENALSRPPARAIDLPGWPLKDPAAVAGRRPPKTADLGDGVKMELVYVPAGTFIMGSVKGYLDEMPRAPVEIDKGFWMGTCEVTNEQFRRFDPDHDSRTEDRHGYQFGIPGYEVDRPGQPAVRLSWRQAMGFCNWLKAQTGWNVTLPTEAQWEWACRAGTDTDFWFGDRDTDFSKCANMGDSTLSLYSGNPYKVDPRKAAYGNPENIYDNWVPQDARFDDGGFVSVEVGRYRPNPWGLRDMHGNVAEWTRSLYLPYPYDGGDRNREDAGGKRVVRGGSWYDRPKRCTASYRFGYRDYQQVFNVGFRVVVEE